MRRRTQAFLSIFFILSFLLSGCYYWSAKKEMGNAQRSLAELKGLGGDKQVPYEYCSAEKFLEVSRLEFNENDYKEAKIFAERSRSAAEAGLSEVRRKK